MSDVADFLLDIASKPIKLLNKSPTSAQINDFLRQTKGIETNEIRKFKGKPILINDKNESKYNGCLSILQQIEILNELYN